MDFSKPAARKTWLKALVLLAVLLAGLWAYMTTDYKQYLTRDRLAASITSMRHYADDMGPGAPVLFVCLSTAAIVVNIPAVITICFGVCIFGVGPGVLMSAISIYLAITAVYFTARVLGRDLVIRLAGSRLEKFESRLSGRGLWAVLYLRLFFFVFPPTNWLLGLSSIGFRDVFWGTVLGTLHHIVIYAWLTELTVETIQRGGSLNPFDTPQLLAPLVVGTVLFIALRIVDRQRRRITGTTSEAAGTNK